MGSYLSHGARVVLTENGDLNTDLDKTGTDTASGIL